MQPYRTIDTKLRRIIADAVGSDHVVTGAEALSAYEADATEIRHLPEMVVMATDAGQISRLLMLANEHRFPVTPRGGGTGLAGGCLALRGGVVLSLEKLNRIKLIDPVNLIGEVEPGVITQTFRDAVAARGLFYPPDPAGLDKSTLGGNAATGAGGPACVKYGTTKDYVLGLEAVLPTGPIVRTGVRTRKGVVGYDLTHLLVGSEGTLGVITGLTLKLLPKPTAVAGLTAVFPDLPAAMRAVTEILVRGHLPSAMEFLDHKCLALVGDLLPFRVAGGLSTLLYIETDGGRDEIARDMDAIGRVCREIGATELLPAPDDDQRARIWDVRRQVSLRIHDHADRYIPEDVVVPIGRIADLVGALPKYENEFGLKIFTFGHAGDGNLHLNITSSADEDIVRVEAGVEAVLNLVVQMQGTISGEHGVGEAKKKYLSIELTPDMIDLQRRIKLLFDPLDILNPGKIF